jgi:hypothetical protein
LDNTMKKLSRGWRVVLPLVLLGAVALWITRRREPDRPIPPSAERSVPSDREAEEQVKPPPAPSIVTEREAPTVEREKPTGDRASIDSTALAGRILDDGGAPVAGAEMTWTALTEDLCDAKVRLIHEGFEKVWSVSPSAVTDEDGAFLLREAPRGARDHVSVVWITHAGHEAARVLFDASSTARTWPPDFRLKRATCIPVQVVDVNGAPATSAEVDEFMAAEEYDGKEAHDIEQKARKVFGRRSWTSSDGRVCGVAAPGMSVWMASRGKLRAAPQWTTKTDKITLVLRPTFRLATRITSDLSGIDPTGATVSVGASPKSYNLDMTWLLPRLGVRADGTSGPIDCPAVALDKLVVRLDGGTFLAAWIERAMPRAGDDVEVTIDAAIGEPLEVGVRDPDDKPLDGARVSVGMEISPLETMQARDGITAADGVAHVVCPRDRRFYVTAFHEGFTYTRTDLLIWDPSSKRVDIKLGKAGNIRGRCMHAGAPVTAFDLVFWTKDIFTADTITVRDEQGRFEIKDVPQGEVTVFAVSNDLPQSPRRTVRVGAEAGDELVIELPDARVLKGRVVSGIDGAPISNARLQPYSSHGGQVLYPTGDWRPIQSDGTFELASVGPEGAGYGIEAPGFAPNYGVVMPGAVEDLRLGTVVLHPLTNLVVRLVGDPTRDYSRYVVWSEYGERRPPTSFDANGEARFDGLRPATYEFDLRLPEGDVEAVNHQINPGSVEALTFDVSPGRALVVGFEPREERARAVAGTLAVVQRARDGREVRRRIAVTASETLRIERLKPGPATLELRDAGDKVLCITSVVIESKSDQRVALVLGGQEHRLRVVDAHGAPLGGTRVELATEEGESPWRARLETDSQGEISVGPITATKLRASLQHPVVGRAYGIPIDLGAHAREPIDIPLVAPRNVEVELLEGMEPREGVQFYFDHPSIGIFQRYFWTSGPGGIADCKGFADGDCTIVINSAGYWPTITPVHIVAGMKPVVIGLNGLGGLRFSAKDRYELPIAGVAIDVRSLDFDASLADWIAAYKVPAPNPDGTDALGQWSVSGLPKGSYTWRAHSTTGEEVTGKCDVRARTVSDVSIVFE